mmetsp:Transcript_28294/g.58019  ORF Transcript_28294/g.58019 Transcript_28294/m.58019 type:complete len:154 (-) Transcript_28294:246-707(-)|eukprot:CAMPEP_0182542166 /NCGR_PEP_ID=MMETSP1323-20130603/29739_1 /TAXON_ID=236787 /ORGANISM="Florenciella parvula, Strain RCC1693" /LENGTH=153 /DNA_ID=CAMNT_0024752995 /DNA_START=43 /DNA_END=504 /DNA_ORIENTATION=+
MSSHINVTRRATANTEKATAWTGLQYIEGNIKGHVNYAECSMLNSILSRPGEQAFIPKACHFDEANNAGRVHGFHHNQGLYSISRRLTKSIAPANVTATYPEGSVHHVDAPQKGEMSLKECHTLASHLQATFGVTNLLPRACSDMLDEAQKRK